MALKRLAKYYVEVPPIVRGLNYQEEPAEVSVIADANWAGDAEGMSSASSGWIYGGNHLLETYAPTQHIVTLSTAESDYIAIARGAAHGL